MSQEPGRTEGAEGDGIIGSGPFDKGLHQTAPLVWVAVALMVAGAILLGGAVVALVSSHAVALALAVAGALVGLFGIGLARRERIMADTT